MAELLFDIHLELDPTTLAGERNPTRAVAEMSRRVAEDHADEHHLTIRHPDPRAVNVGHGTDRLTGRPVVLVATRWLADTRG